MLFNSILFYSSTLEFAIFFVPPFRAILHESGGKLFNCWCRDPLCFIIRHFLQKIIFELINADWDIKIFELKVQKKKSKPRLISISTAEGKWHGNWESEYLFSLRDLQLLDLSDDDVREDTAVSVFLTVERVNNNTLFVYTFWTVCQEKLFKDKLNCSEYCFTFWYAKLISFSNEKVVYS